MEKAKNILVTGLTRNSEGHLSTEIKRIQTHLSEVFSEVKFLVIESDSSDKTLSELKKIKANTPNFEFLSLGKLEKKYPKRIERLTKCRNVYVNEIRSNKRYRLINYVAVFDFDIKNNRLDLKVLNTWLNQKNWAALFTNQTGSYYDIYALRKKGWNENDCFVEFRRLKSSLPSKLAKKEAIWGKMVRIPKDSKPIKVQSAFGGLGIYRKEIFVRYDYTPPLHLVEESEHVVLHYKIDKKYGGLFILPSLTNFSWNPHNLSKFEIFRKFDSLTNYAGLKKTRKFLRKRLA
jgi:hypothetical protein